MIAKRNYYSIFNESRLKGTRIENYKYTLSFEFKIQSLSLKCLQAVEQIILTSILLFLFNFW
jgi:hypothetical protein